MKYNSYTVTVTDDYYVPAEDEQCLVWRSEVDKDFKPAYSVKEGFKTFGDAMAYVYSLNTSDSILIDDECCGLVYESTNEHYKCDCCGHERWEKMESDSHHDSPKEHYHLSDKQ